MAAVPFLAGKPVSGQYFVGRERILRTIDTIMAGTADGAINNVMLLGPRRIGKSSILLNVKKRQDRDSRMATVMINAEGMSTKQRFADAYMKAVLAAYEGRAKRGAWRSRISRAASSGLKDAQGAISELDLSILECVKFGVKINNRRPDPDGLLEHALGFPEKLGSEKDLAFLVIIDEFQNLLKWGAQFLHLFRRMVQEQTHVGYILAGSSPSMMEGIIRDANSPFYRQLHEVRVSPLQDSVLLPFLRRRLRHTGISVEEGAAERICRLSRGIPDYLQRLGMHSYTACVVRGGRTITLADVESSYSDMLTHLDPVFMAQFDSLRDREKDALHAISRSHNTVTSMADYIKVQPTAMPSALARLIRTDIVEKYERGRYTIADGVFADWLARRYDFLDA